jgi:hypothetical protein
VKIGKAQLIQALAPPLDADLVSQLIDEYLSMERRYILGEWEPSTLDGGQFVEAASRIIYHQDAGNLDKRRSVDRCLKYVEDATSQNHHSYPDRKSALHLCKVIRSIYKFRSDRGAVHIDPEYTANQIDSKLVLDNSRWTFAEILRLFWNADRDAVAAMVDRLSRIDVPIVGVYDDLILVQRPGCTIEEEILILLFFAEDQGLARRDLGRFIKRDPSTITKKLKHLVSANVRQVVELQSQRFRLTDLGIRRVRDELSERMKT